MSGIYVAMNGWREILARVFDGFTAQPNVTPDWLVNPTTNRRLKLDLYYPEAGFAVRFIGLQAKGQRRQSDWEALEEQQREQSRVDLCRANDVQLLLIDPFEETVKQLDTMTRLLRAPVVCWHKATFLRARRYAGCPRWLRRESEPSHCAVASTETRSR